MEKQVLLSIVLQLVFHLILFILFVRFYLIEQMGDYFEDRATTTSRLIKVTKSEFPTITICMDPALKPSVVAKYGFQALGEIVTIDVPNTTLSEKLESLSYILNQDFSIKIIRYEQKFQEFALKIGQNKLFIIEPVVTFLQGICYKMEPKFTVTSEWVDIWFSIQFKQFDEDDLDQPSNLVMYLTSPNATLNVATDIWPQYLPGIVKVPFNTKRTTIIKYDRTIEYIFKEGVKNSSECMSKVVEESGCQQCCHLSGCSLPICNSSEGFACIWGNHKLGQKCLLLKQTLAYLPQLSNSPIYYPNSSTSSGVFIISTTSDTKQIIEEIDVITLSGLIGSIGGSLGMFFGFSFTSYLSFVIGKISKNIFKP